MSNMIVVAFPNATRAYELRDKLIELQKEHVITLEDAAVAVRNDDGKVKIKQVTSLTGAGALGGAFWGMLIGILFFMPWLGLAIGAISGAIAGRYSDIGIDDKFIKEVSTTIEPGHSALFLLVREATADKVLPELAKFSDGVIIQTSLSDEQEAQLREAFSGHDVDADEAAAA
jgi:uncharacterized membrane protein